VNLSLTNTTQEPETIAAPDGSFADALTPGTPYDLNNAAEVLVIGDKPDVREQLQQAASVITGVVKHLLMLIAGRKQQQQYAAELVDVTILNRGEKAVRVILGDGTTDVEIEPGESTRCKALGYLELRELGDLDQSQVDGGTQTALA